MLIEPAAVAHLDGWVRLRGMLWRDDPLDDHRAAATDWLRHPDRAAWVAVEGNVVAGFAEASLRRDYVNGCETSPVAFLEGIAVLPV